MINRIFQLSISMIVMLGAWGHAAVGWALPYDERLFQNWAVARDKAAGQVVVENKEAILFSEQIDVKAKSCSPVLSTTTAETDSYRERRSAEVARQRQAKVQYEQAARDYETQTAQLREKLNAWQVGYSKIKSDLEVKTYAAQMERSRMEKTGQVRQAQAVYEQKIKALNDQYVTPLGDQPVLPPPPQKPTEIAVKLDEVQRRSVQFYLARLDSDPNREAVRIIWRDAKALPQIQPRAQYGVAFATLHPDDAKFINQQALLTVSTLCPDADQVEINVGFHDVVALVDTPSKSSMPMVAVTLRYYKQDGNWTLEWFRPAATGFTRAEVINLVDRVSGAKKSDVDKYAWLNREEYDYALGYFLVPPKAGLPGIVYRNHAFWNQFELDSEVQRLLRIGAIGDAHAKSSFSSARAVYDGHFQAIGKNWGAFSDLIIKYEAQCNSQLQREDPVLYRRTYETVSYKSGMVRDTKIITEHEVKIWVAKRYHDALKRAQETSDSAVGDAIKLVVNPNRMQIASQQMDRAHYEQAAAVRFLRTEGCASASTHQMLENYRRAIMGEPSLQSDAMNKKDGAVASKALEAQSNGEKKN